MAKIDWNVYLVHNCSYTDPPKAKFILTFQFDFGIHGFLINSKIPRFALKQIGIRPCFVSLKRNDDHSFLDYDSFIACNEIFKFTIDDLYDCKGSLNDKAKGDVIKAITACRTLRIKFKNGILSNYRHLYP